MFRTIRRFIRKVTNREDKYPTIILPYRTYGTQQMVYLQGRVMEDKNIRPKKDDNLYDVLKHAYKRFHTDEKPFTEVKATTQGNSFLAETNFEGYFRIHESTEALNLQPNKANWIDVHYELTQESGTTATSQMLVPHPNVDFGIISDIDDTILHTGVTSFLKLKVLYNSFFKSATDREPLTGASLFYRALELGPSKKGVNPFFYISNSPWNLYNYLGIFLREKKFPKGPVLLRDLALPWAKNYKTEKKHKQREIRNIFQTYPNMQFILFGDSAEHDANIYSEVAKEFPEQVICIYLHTVEKASRMRNVHEVMKQSEHVEMVLVNNALQAAEHAVEKGLISDEAYQDMIEGVPL